MAVDISKLDICSPKRIARRQAGWEGFFPYYAGFPERFAERVLVSAGLCASDTVLDPWNGSGTTTYSASKLGIGSIGIDLNPVMAIVARARALAANESDSIIPLGRELIARANAGTARCQPMDPLAQWFGPQTSAWLRRVEQAARCLLLGERTLSDEGVNLDGISAIASTFYVALFALVRELAVDFQTSNPTWLRYPKSTERRVGCSSESLGARYAAILANMASALENPTRHTERGNVDIRVADSTQPLDVKREGVEFVLTSPPYCTRIDYTAATRMQLSVLWPLLNLQTDNLSRSMLGSVKVPTNNITRKSEWGSVCNKFLLEIEKHPSKASKTYYLRTHLDYFDKLARSLQSTSSALCRGGVAVMVVQDSYYKNIHNDLPRILGEMASCSGLHLRRREDFSLRRTLAGRHPHSRNYRSELTATEAVLCFEKVI